MILCILAIQATDVGVAIEQIPIRDDGIGHERAIASILDIGLRVAQEYVSKCLENGVIIEGKNVESHVSGMLSQIGAENLRKEMTKAGVEFPKDKP